MSQRPIGAWFVSKVDDLEHQLQEMPKRIRSENDVDLRKESTGQPPANGREEENHSINFLQISGLPKIVDGNITVDDTIQSKRNDFWIALYAIPSMGFGMIYTFIMTLIPYQNQILDSNCWYELAILVAIYPLMFTVDALLQSCYCFKAPYMISLSALFRVYVPTSLLGLFPYCAAVVIWTTLYDYNLPLPLTPVVLNLGVITFAWMLWREISLKNMDAGDRSRIMWFLFCIIYGALFGTSYQGLHSLKESLPFELEWTVAIILPIVRHLILIVGEKIVLRAKPNDVEVMNFQLHMGVKCFHEFFIVLHLAQLHISTFYAILGVEFLLHLYTCYEIISIYRKTYETTFQSEVERSTNMEKLITDLVLDLIIEIYVPICYLVTFISAYFGPNAHILGNIGNSYWNFKAVENVEDVISVDIQMAGIDFGMLLTTGTILRIVCGINLFKEYCKLMKSYWFWIGIRLAMTLFRVSKYKCNYQGNQR